jgi:hypothetical protein
MARTTFSGPVKVDTAFWANPILFANLPTAAAANEGYIYYVSDALKASETTGNGTGNLVFSDGSNWIRVDTGATAAA